jgi:hypothetical protein
MRRWIQRMLPVALLAAILAPLPPAAHAATPVTAPTAFPIALDSGIYGEVGPTAAADGQGNYAVAWQRLTRAESRYERVTQRFDPHGKPRGPILPVSATGGSLSSIAMNPHGDFVVAWAGSDSPCGAQGCPVHARLFPAGGTGSGEEITVSTSEATWAYQALVGIDREGGFVVAWTGPKGAFVRRFDRHGTPLGPEQSVVGPDAPQTFVLGLAVQPDGRFTLAWYQNSGPDHRSIMARRYGANGKPIGPELRINQEELTGSLRTLAAAATAAGGFVVTWDQCSGLHAATVCEVYARPFDAAGNPLSADLLVSPKDDHAHFQPTVAAATSRGQFAVAWQNCYRFPEDCKASVQLYEQDGSPARGIETLKLSADLRQLSLAPGPSGFTVILDAMACGNPFPDCGGAEEGIYGWSLDLPR